MQRVLISRIEFLAPGQHGGMVITVGDIVVVDSGMLEDPFPNVESIRTDILRTNFVVSFPIDTQLPVSRDDIILTPKSFTSIYFLNELLKLVDLCVSIKPTQQHPYSPSIDFLFRSLNAYAKYSGQPAIYSIIKDLSGYVKSLEHSNTVIFVPESVLRDLILKEFPSSNVVVYSGCLLSITTKRVVDLFESRIGKWGQNIVKSIRLFPARVSIPTDAGLPSCLFIPMEWYNHQDLVTKVVSTSPRLILEGTSYSDHNNIDDTWQSFWKNYSRRDVFCKLVKRKYVLNPFFSLCADLIHTLFLAVYSFTLSLDFNNVHTYNLETLRGYNLMFVRAAGARLMFIMNSVLEPLALFIKISQIRSHLLAVDKVRDYINRLIAFFTTITIDAVYGSVTSLIFAGTYWDPLFNTIHHGDTIRNLDNYVSSDAYMLFDALSTCLDISSYKHRVPIKLFTFLNAMHIPFFTIARLVNGLIHKDAKSNSDTLVKIGQTIVQKAENGFEGSIIAFVVFGALKNIDHEKHGSVIQWIDTLFTESRTKYTREFMRNWMYYNHTTSNSNEYISKYTEQYILPMQRMLMMCLEHNTSSETSYGLLHTASFTNLTDTSGKPKRHVHFKANQLIDYVFSLKTGDYVSDLNTRTKLFEFLDLVTQHTLHLSRPKKLQIVQIAANEGTSKPFIDSVLTELLQNSVDAIRSKPASDTNIIIDVNENLIRVKDFVGIPIEAYLSLWIPFLSSKTDIEIMTGEMGTGFYNIFRQPWCGFVEITSDNISTVATPIIEDSRVVDILYTVIELPKMQGGTTITITLSDRLSPQDKISLAMEGVIHTRNQLAYIDYPLTLNGANVNIQKTLVVNTNVGQCYVTNSPSPSVLLTNGIPIGPLSQFLSQLFGEDVNPDIETGIMVDVHKKYYQATQSRNRLILSDNPKKNNTFLQFLRVGIFRCLIHKIHTKVINENREDVMESYFPNASSTASYHNFIGYNNIKSFLDGVSFFNSKGMCMSKSCSMSTCEITFVNVFHMYFTHLDTLENNSKVTDADFRNGWLELTEHKSTFNLELKHLEYIRKRVFRNVIPDASDLIRKWFVGKKFGEKEQVNKFAISTKTKTKRPRNEIQKPSSSYDEGAVVVSESEMKDIDNLIRMVSVICTAYYYIGSKDNTISGLDFTKGPPTVVVSPNDSPYTAYYTKTDHKLTIIYKKVKEHTVEYIKSWNIFKSKIIDEGIMGAMIYAKTSASFYKFVGKCVPASTIVHELQHALFKTGHTSSDAHGTHTYSLGGITYTTPFEVTCSNVYDYLVTQGLWTKICEIALEA